MKTGVYSHPKSAIATIGTDPYRAMRDRMAINIAKSAAYIKRISLNRPSPNPRTARNAEAKSRLPDTSAATNSKAASAQQVINRDAMLSLTHRMVRPARNFDR